MSDTYSGFLVNLNRLIDGENVSVSEIPRATLEAIVSLGERRIYREVRSRHNELSYSGTTLNNTAAIPADFEANSVLHFGQGPLIPLSEEQILQMLYDGGRHYIQYYAEAGSSFIFAPAVGDGAPIQGRYYARLPDLSEATIAANALYQAESDLFVYACLCESAPFFGQDKRMPLWESKYQAIKDELNQAKNRAAFSGGRMQMRQSITQGRRAVTAPGVTSTPASDSLYADNYADSYA